MIAARPNTRKYFSGALMAIFVLWATAVGTAANDKVVLATGEVMTVDQAQLKDGRVWITWKGLSLSIAEKDVLRIESSGKSQILHRDQPSSSRTEPTEPKDRHPEAASKRGFQVQPPPAERSAANRTAGEKGPQSDLGKNPESSEPAAPSAEVELLLTFVEPDGFGDIKWGDHRSAQTGLKRLYQKSELPDVIEYVRPSDSLKLGPDAESATIKYAFWQDRLYMVTLWASGPEAFDSIRQAMVDKFGRGVPKPGSPQTLFWIDDDADRMIEYLADKDLSLLWMRSREIHHEYKLTQLRIPINAGRSPRIETSVEHPQTKN